MFMVYISFSGEINAESIIVRNILQGNVRGTRKGLRCVPQSTRIICSPLAIEEASEEEENGVGGLEMMLECWN
jgi:hypothetical protein